MKKIKIITICLAILSMVMLLTGCKADLKEGKYVLENGDGQSYITISDYTKEGSEYLGFCKMQFKNVDFTTFEEHSVNNTFLNYITNKGLTDLSEEEQEKLKKEFEANLNFEKQFVENKSLFEYGYSEEQEGYWLMSEINGSGFDDAFETYVNMQYIPEENALVFDERKYILEK